MPEKIKNDLEFIDNADQLFSVLRHELGNPVNSLKMTLEVLTRNYDLFEDAKRLDFLQNALDQVTRLHRFLDALKMYSRTGVNRIGQIPFIPIWKAFLNSLEQKLAGKNIRFKQSTPSAPYLIHADKAACGCVLNSLIDNAIEAVEQANDPTIELKAIPKNGYIVIVVKDNGEGIKKDNFDRIFTPLFTTKKKGEGIGLSIAHKLLTKMGGWIEVDSHTDRGTEMRVGLKLAD